MPCNQVSYDNDSCCKHLFCNIRQVVSRKTAIHLLRNNTWLLGLIMVNISSMVSNGYIVPCYIKYLSFWNLQKNSVCSLHAYPETCGRQGSFVYCSKPSNGGSCENCGYQCIADVCCFNVTVPPTRLPANPDLSIGSCECRRQYDGWVCKQNHSFTFDTWLLIIPQVVPWFF